jgi:hypothetical protein
MTNEHDGKQGKKLAESLLKATQGRSIEWRLAEPEVYSWATAAGSVTIASRDRDGEPPYELAIFNPENVKVDTVKSELLGGDVPAPWNESLAELYSAARRSAFRADELIEALIDAVRVAEPGESRREGLGSLLHRAP